VSSSQYSQLRWEDELFAHPDLTPGQKITLRSLYEPMINGTQGLEHIEIWKIAQQTGQSDKTVGKTIQFFNDHGILRRDVQHDRLTQKTQVSIEVAEPVLHPKRIQLPERPKSGYHPPKQKCPACGGELDIETAVSCKCGLKHTVSIRPATKHDTELVEKFTELARLDKQLSSSGGQLVGRPPSMKIAS
jgi:hypothetical protein